ncbi:MAG: hypothetical protein GF411_16615 [Candidatus Lokiarchaeota archaeon]|nr:hypothetical protein [Candidatus Lokiarchaeota archaeon]
MAEQSRIEPLPSSVLTFAYEFVSRMRKRDDVRVKPSVRQTQSIPQLVSAKFFRKGKLSLDDLVNAAVFTTFPIDQEIAREVAEDILLGKKDEIDIEKKTEKEKPGVSKSTHLESVIDQIRREQELAKTIQKDKVREGYEYLMDIRKHEDRSLYDMALEYLNDGDIVLRGISSDDMLSDEIRSEISKRIGNLSPEDIQNASVLDYLEEILLSQRANERLSAQALSEDQGFDQDFTELLRHDRATGAKTLRFLTTMQAFDSHKLEALDIELQQSLENLTEVADYSKEVGKTPEDIEKFVEDAPLKYRYDVAMGLAESIKKQSGEDIRERLTEAYRDQFDTGARENVDLPQLAEKEIDSQSWKELLEKQIDRIIDDSDCRASPEHHLLKAAAQSSDLKKEIESAENKREWMKSIQKLADSSVERAQTKTELRNIVKTLRRHNIEPTHDMIRKTGEKLGMSEAEILELLNPSFEVIKKLINEGLQDFDRLYGLMSSAGLTSQQLRELADLAYSKGNQSALGAVAHVDLKAALGMSGGRGYGSGAGDGSSSEREEMVVSGLHGGPAANIVKIWYTYRDEIPSELKQKLKNIAKRLLIDLGQRFSRATMGSSMLGGIQQSTTVRPFRIGDDIDLIELEETIDSLLSQGRTNFEVLNTEDFLISETYQGHRAYFWALDKSGSMNSPDKLGMLAISVMAGLYGVQKDDFGVVLFDNVTHVVKQIQDRSVSVDKVAAELLDVRASGGTGGLNSMKMALDNFTHTRAKEKIFIFNTDMYLSDQSECEKVAAKLHQQGVKTLILVPEVGSNMSAGDSLARAAHGVIIAFGSIDELPEKLLRLTNY